MVRLLQCWGWWWRELRVRNFEQCLADVRGIGGNCGPSPYVLAAINSVNEAPEALNDYSFRKSSGSLAIFAAIRANICVTPATDAQANCHCLVRKFDRYAWVVLFIESRIEFNSVPATH